MNLFFVVSASGWIAAILMGIEILLPYLLRRTRLSESLGLAHEYASPYLRRMWPHYWAGYLLLMLSVAHAWIPMQTGHLRRASSAGLWFATVGLCLLFFQALLGVALQDAKLQGRAQIRSWHYWMMLGVGSTVAIHVWLNG